MLIKQIASMLLALEGLLSWCWLLNPAEMEIFVLANISLLAGAGVAIWLRGRATTVLRIGGCQQASASLTLAPALRRAA